MIVMSETGTGYRASEFPLVEGLLSIFLSLVLPATALTGLWGSPERGVVAPVAAAATALLAGSVVSLISAWRQKRWVELAFSGEVVRWGSGTSTHDASPVAHFAVDRSPEGGLYCLFAVQHDGEEVGLRPQWESWRSEGLLALADRLNELTRSEATP